MIVREDGKIYGTIGGGAVEHEAIEEQKILMPKMDF